VGEWRLARILFISHSSDLGGPPHSLLKLLKYLRAEHDVAVVAPGDGGLFESLRQMRVPSYRVGAHGLTRQCIPALSRVIARGAFDLVYGNNVSTRNALIAAKLTGKPFVWHIREMLGQAQWRTAFFLRYADAIIAVSQACARSVKHHVPRKHVHVVYNGVDLKEFQLGDVEARQHVHSILGIPGECAVVVSVGHICVRKGQQQAVSVAAELLPDHPTAVFSFLGRLDLEPKYTWCLKHQIAHWKLTDKIRFLGFRSDIRVFLTGCDVFLHAAVRDPCPRSVLDAMAARLPVVACDVDGVSEMVVQHETGYLVPVGDVAAMADAVKDLLGNQSLRVRMGERARARVESKFLASQTARKVNCIIRQLL